MNYLKLDGTYYEIGAEFGKSRSGLDKFDIPSAERLEYAIDCEKELKNHAPDLLNELRGFADGIDIEYDLIAASFLVPVEMFGCNLFLVGGDYTSSGNPIFVRHMDWLEEDLVRVTLLETNPNNKYKVLGFNFADFGYYDGMNETGLAIGTASIPFYTGKNAVGLRENIATRWALDNFSTVQEVIDYLENIPHAQAIVFLVADAAGNSARVECTPLKVESEISSQSLNVVGNFFKLDNLKEHDNMPQNDRARAYDSRIREWFSQSGKGLTLDDIKRICRSHDSGICEHLEDLLGGTIYSWISELGTDTIHLAVGYPCRNEYQEYRLGV